MQLPPVTCTRILPLIQLLPYTSTIILPLIQLLPATSTVILAIIQFVHVDCHSHSAFHTIADNDFHSVLPFIELVYMTSTPILPSSSVSWVQIRTIIFYVCSYMLAYPLRCYYVQVQIYLHVLQYWWTHMHSSCYTICA